MVRLGFQSTAGFPAARSVRAAFALFLVWNPLVAQDALAEPANCPRPAIVSRAAWSAAPPVGERMRLQVPKSIVIHHTGVESHPHLPLEKKLRDLQLYSQRPGRENGRPKRALGDMPYHFFIGYDGRIGEGRGLEFAGDTRTNYNPSDKIQIAVEGDFTNEQPQAEQLKALQALLCWLRVKYAIADNDVRTHRDLADTSCPGKNLLSTLPGVKRPGQ